MLADAPFEYPLYPQCQNDQELTVVRKIRTLRKKGLSYQNIADRLINQARLLKGERCGIEPQSER